MSILKLFRNLKLSITLLFLLLVLLFVNTLVISFDFNKIDLSKKVQNMSDEILKFDINNGKISQQLLKEHQLYMNIAYENIKELHDKDLIETLVKKSAATAGNLDKLGQSLKALHLLTTAYYISTDESYIAKIEDEQYNLALASTHLNASISNDVAFKNRLALYLVSLVALDLLLILFWYAYRLKLVYRDIAQMLNVDQEDRSKEYKSVEFKAIKKRMERRPVSSGGKNLLDPLTGLLNEKGIINEFVQNKTLSSKSAVYVVILDVDDFKELARNHGKDFTDAVIKKIAFILNLEKKPLDLIARMGEDQFILIIARESQAEAFSVADGIRKIVETTKFKTLSETVLVTLSGGLASKERHEKIESAIDAANMLVKRAKVQGKNSIVKKQGFSNDKNERM